MSGEGILQEIRSRGAPLGIIAGNGPLPALFARAARLEGLRLVAVGHTGETSGEIEGLVDQMIWIHVGEVGSLIRGLREGGVTQAVMLGGIDKRRALKDLRIDERAMGLLQRLASRGDDSLLGALAMELEGEGIEILSSHQLLAPWLAPSGCFSSREATPRELADLRLGSRVLGQLGDLDIGQTVVVKEGIILAVEAIEGTDRAIARGGELGGAGAVVIKGTKPGQDMRFDVPAVGAGTLGTMVAVGATVLALEAGQTLLVDRDVMVNLADETGVALVGWSREKDICKS
jgi:UDP-2,3-diacylglucosamine hydrolase